MGQADANLDTALALIRDIPKLKVERVSDTYFTEPQGFKEQPWFANRVAAVICEPGLDSLGLLDALASIEDHMGRVRSDDPDLRFGPRVIDLDVLLFGQEIREQGRLILPHPRMRERAFVLVPLAEIAPGLVLPGGETVEAALGRLGHTVQGNRIAQD